MYSLSSHIPHNHQTLISQQVLFWESGEEVSQRNSEKSVAMKVHWSERGLLIHYSFNKTVMCMYGKGIGDIHLFL